MHRRIVARLNWSNMNAGCVTLSIWIILVWQPHVSSLHIVWLSEEEKEIIRKRGVKVTHCPGSNMKLSSGIAEIPDLLNRQIAVGIGADGAPCNNNLDMFQEMRLTALIQKVPHGPTIMDARTVLRMATMGGAEVLGLSKEIGSLEVGKRQTWCCWIWMISIRILRTRPIFIPVWCTPRLGAVWTRLLLMEALCSKPQDPDH